MRLTASYEFSFDRETAETIFENLDFEEKYGITLDDFLDDFKDNLCLVYIENDSYHFIHRSFQEYFTALFLVKQNAEFLKNPNLNKQLDEYSSPKFTVSKHSEDGVADGLIFFDKSPLDPVFMFMMQMKPTKLVNNILLPKLKGIFGYYREPCSIGEFMEKVYDPLHYTVGEVEGGLYPELRSDILSFIYSRICKESYDYHDMMELDVPKEFEMDVQYRAYDKEDNLFFISENQMDFGDTKEEDRPKPSGKIYEIPISKLRENTPKYGDLLEQIYEEFKEEYASFIKAYAILVERYPR